MTEPSYSEFELVEVTQADEAMIDAIWKHSLNWGSREDMLELAARHRLPRADERGAR